MQSPDILKLTIEKEFGQLFPAIEELKKMGLFDGYFDPRQFEDSGGLLGRLLSLQQQQGQYQPGDGFDPQFTASGRASSAPPMPVPLLAPAPTLPALGAAANPQMRDYGRTQNIPIGGDQMPQFAGTDIPQTTQQPPGLDDRLSAGFQSWAHTPVGDLFAALANGIAGMSSGQRTDAAGLAPSQTQAPSQSPELGDRLSAGFQSWAHTPLGNPLAALANGVAGLSSGQRTDPAGMAAQILQPRIDAAGNPQQDLNSQYQALRPILGDHHAMLAIVHPEVGNTLIAQALAGRTKPGNAGDADPSGNGQAGLGNEASSIAGGQPPGLNKVRVSRNSDQR